MENLFSFDAPLVLDTARPDHDGHLTTDDGDARGTSAANRPLGDDPSRARRSPRSALPELAKDLALVDSHPDFAGQETAGPNVGDALLLRKIEAFSAWMGRHGAHPTRCGRRDAVSITRTLWRIGHAGARPGKEVRAAIIALKDTHGFGATFDARHDPERQIDRDLDEYERMIAVRGKGPPRSIADPTKPCRVGVARELGAYIRDLDATCMRRLRTIMAGAREPGDIYQPTADDPSPNDNMKRNPAVPPLLRGGLANYTAGFPADPLDPKELDLITIAADCGVSPLDILQFPDNLALIRSSRGDCPLVPHPALAERRYTYKDLREGGRQARRDDPGGNADPGQASRISVGALMLFLTTTYAGGGLDDIVPLDFADRVEQAFGDRPEKAGSGWMAEMRRWIGWNDALRASKPLPQPFALACRVLCHEVGLSVGALGRRVGSEASVRAWLAGFNVPSLQHAETLEAMEATLKVPNGTLAKLLSEEWRSRRFDEDLFELHEDGGDVEKRRQRRKRHARHLPRTFAELPQDERQAILERNHWAIVNQDSDFARRQAEMSRDEYILAKEHWPPALLDAWNGMIPKPRRSVLRRPGEVIAPPPLIELGGRGRRKDEWRPQTIEHREALLGSVTGYWTRERKLSEKQLAGFQARKTDFTPEAGLGIPLSLLHPVLFALPDLLSVFCHWRARRSGAEIATFKNALQLAAEFVRPDTGPVWKDSGMLAQLEAFKAWWDANPHDTPEGPVTLDIEPFRRTGARPSPTRTPSSGRTFIAFCAASCRNPATRSSLWMSSSAPRSRWSST